jgi:hypothetical protein
MNQMICHLYNAGVEKISLSRPGAKLAPFNSEGAGVCQNCPAKTDDALQQIFISDHYFPKNVGEREGGGG